MATIEPKPITPALQNCSITEPAASSDGKYYLDPSHMTVTLKANAGYIFGQDGTLTYLSEYSSNIPITITATKTDTASVSLPATVSWYDQFDFPLTMSAVKDTTTPAPTPTTTTPTTSTTPSTTPATGTTPTTSTTTPATTTPAPSTTPKTQLDKQLATLKSSLRIPLDIDDDDELIKSYLQSATEYLASTLGEENVTSIDSKLGSKRAKVVINEIATLMYQNRGDDTVTKDFPFTLRALINQLKY